MATTLLPFREYDEHDVINLFAYDGALDRGHVVKILSGWKNTDETQLMGNVGGSFTNTVSQRYGVKAKLDLADASGDKPLGVLLHDVKETDENGEKLVFNPRKAAEMEVALSGQAVPILTKGIVLYSGSALTTDAEPGALLYHDDNGDLTHDNTNGVVVGICLGSTGENGEVLVKLDVNVA